MLEFRDISSLKPGDIYKTLVDSYRSLSGDYDPGHREQYLRSWKKSDKIAFSIPTIGSCIFVSYLDSNLVGFISYDPRNYPEYLVVGQNCVLSKYKGLGFGKEQLSHLVEFTSKQGYAKMIVTSGAIEFFLPAQKMYRSAGFKETRRFRNKEYGYDEIEYVLKM